MDYKYKYSGLIWGEIIASRSKITVQCVKTKNEIFSILAEEETMPEEASNGNWLRTGLLFLDLANG